MSDLEWLVCVCAPGYTCMVCAERAEQDRLAAAREEGRQAGLLEGERARTLSPCSDCGDGYPARYLRGGRCLDCAVRHAYRAGQEAMRERAAGAVERLYSPPAEPETEYREGWEYACDLAEQHIRALPVEDQP